MRTVLVLLLCAGCARVPSTLREPTADQRDAIALTIDTWADWREPVRARVLDDALVAVIEHEELQEWCLAYSEPVNGCLSNVQRHVGDPPHAGIYVSASLTDDEQIAVVIHETLHALRSLYTMDAKDDWYEYSRRLHEGEWEGCPIHRMVDYCHCDLEVWTGIEPDAYRRWLEHSP